VIAPNFKYSSFSNNTFSLTILIWGCKLINVELIYCKTYLFLIPRIYKKVFMGKYKLFNFFFVIHF